MTQQLDMRQRNNLLVGNRLAAELATSDDSRRAFVVVTPYREDDDTPQYDTLGRRKRKKFSKFINADHSDIRFNVLVFEVDVVALAAYIEESRISWDATIEVDKLASYSGIVSIERLEDEALNNHLDDLSRMDVDWRVIPWWD